MVGGKEGLITNGPFAEGAELVGGYVILPANDLDHAAEISKGCPILEMGGTIEVRPVADM